MPHRSTTDADEAAFLRAAGAQLVRHAHDMVLDLPTAAHGDVPLPDGLTLHAGVELGPSLTRAALAAYPAGHPDAGPFRTYEEAAQELDELLAGRAAGPLLQHASATVTDTMGAVVGALIVT